MKIFALIFLISCSHINQESQINPHPSLPPKVPRELISKPKEDFSAAIDQTKSYFCIKNGNRFNKGISCEKYSQNLHNICSKKFKLERKVLNCLVRSLKI